VPQPTRPFIHRTTSRSRSIRLSITPAGEVLITTPPWVPQFQVKNFVADHEDWIAKSLAKIESHRSMADTKDTLFLFGKSYAKKITNNPEQPYGIHLSNATADKTTENSITINTLSTATKPAALLERFLKNTATQYIIPRVHQIGKHMGITFNNVSLKQQKTRWGSCSSDGNLNFNWRLVHAPTEVIDYVIIHELAHRIHMNHSAHFWELVSQFDPEHSKHRGWLKRNGMSVG
jgi:predicted metal-dependent hydrolase